MLCIDIKIGNVIPVDWIYSPIISLYSSQQKNKSVYAEEQQTQLVLNCLRWIFIYETYFPSLANMLNPTGRFCRLACIFLGSDNLFLHEEIQELLKQCLKNLVANMEEMLNFDKEIEGLNNFQDFYIQLLEQYQGVSYGNVLFGNFILIPLAQRHNIKWRKILWSEYGGILQIFNVSKEQVFCSIEGFYEPIETDLSLLKCYRKAILNGCVRKNSILYDIASHHVEMYIKLKKKEK